MSGAVDPRLLRETPRGLLLAAVGLGLATTALVLVQAGLLARVLATALLAPDELAGSGPALAALVVVVLLRAAVTWAQSVVAVRCSTQVASVLRGRLARHAQALGPAWLAGQRGGELTVLMTRGLDALDPWFARYLPQVLLSVLVPVAVVGRLATVDRLSAVVVAVTLPLVPLFMVLVGLRTRDRADASYDRLAALGGHFLDAVRGLPTLRLHGRATGHAASIRRAGEDHRRVTMQVLSVAFLSAMVLELIATLSVALVAVEVGLRLVHGGIGYEAALLVLLLAPEAYLPLRRLGVEHHACQDGLAAADRVFAVLAEEPPRRGVGGVVPRGQVQLQGVTVALPGRDGPVLDALDLVLRPGERVAVVGPSGAGKSTLLDVLLRFREPDHGRLLVDGQDVRDTGPAVWRQRTAWLPQAPVLLAGTVAANVRLGLPDDTDVDAALGAVGLAGTAAGVLGEDGRGLSAGQRRRVALARALLRVEVLGADLLLLDEPTGSLDAVSAAAVRTALAGLPPWVTVVAVTHDPGVAAAADRVVHLPGATLDLVPA